MNMVLQNSFHVKSQEKVFGRSIASRLYEDELELNQKLLEIQGHV